MNRFIESLKKKKARMKIYADRYKFFIPFLRFLLIFAKTHTIPCGYVFDFIFLFSLDEYSYIRCVYGWLKVSWSDAYSHSVWNRIRYQTKSTLLVHTIKNILQHKRLPLSSMCMYWILTYINIENRLFSYLKGEIKKTVYTLKSKICMYEKWM